MTLATDRALWDKLSQQEAHYQRRLAEIESALAGYCSLHCIYGTRRWTGASRYYGGHEESAASALAREVRLLHCERPWPWGREYWMTRRSEGHFPLIAWTEDKNGRIVRGWKRHLGKDEVDAYDTPGNRSCPIEAAWIASVAVGRPSFPAFPFQRALDGDAEAELAVGRLLSAREREGQP
jgi:hypothetical protein